MKIAAAMHQSQYAKAPHPTLTLDGIALDVWLCQQTSEPDVLDLVPAQGWLWEDADRAFAWRRLKPGSAYCRTTVPLLICPDDLDLACTVVVVEQEVRDKQVFWHRFGLEGSRPKEPFGTTVHWFKNNVAVQFPLEPFNAAAIQLEALINDAG